MEVVIRKTSASLMSRMEIGMIYLFLGADPEYYNEEHQMFFNRIIANEANDTADIMLPDHKTPYYVVKRTIT